MPKRGDSVSLRRVRNNPLPDSGGFSGLRRAAMLYSWQRRTGYVVVLGTEDFSSVTTLEERRLGMVRKDDDLRRQVFFLDDEPTVCAAVKETLEGVNISVHCFTHPAECLAQLDRGRCDVLITDLRMPEKNGIDLLREVRALAPWIPVLIVTAYGDIPTAVTAIKTGAVDLIEKPLGKDGFVEKVKLLLEWSRMVHLDGFRALTRAEWEVLRLIVAGKSNSEIAAGIKRARRTVEAHRRGVMRKLGVHNLVQLLKVAAAARLVDLPMRPGSTQDGQQVNDRPAT